MEFNYSFLIPSSSFEIYFELNNSMNLLDITIRHSSDKQFIIYSVEYQHSDFEKVSKDFIKSFTNCSKSSVYKLNLNTSIMVQAINGFQKEIIKHHELRFRYLMNVKYKLK